MIEFPDITGSYLREHARKRLERYSNVSTQEYDISPERVPAHLRGIGEGIHIEMCRRFMFLLDVSLMVNHDLDSESFCYHLVIFRKGISHLRSNDLGNKLCVALGCVEIEVFYINKGKQSFATHDYSDPDLLDHLTRTIERFFNCHAHQSSG